MSDRDALERAAADAWPAAEAEERDGWLLRRTPSVTRTRSNSALPLRPDADVAVVEGWYGVRGARPQVQVSPLEDRTALEAEVRRRGWVVQTEADVLTAAGPLGEPKLPIAVLRTLQPRWLEAWTACEGRDRADVDAHAETILSQLEDRVAYAMAPDAKGVALAVRSDDGAHTGLFCVAVREDARRQGIAAALVLALAGWAGESTLYAQVERGNAPGQDLWRALGFTRAHGYRTWAQP